MDKVENAAKVILHRAVLRPDSLNVAECRKRVNGNIKLKGISK